MDILADTIRNYFKKLGLDTDIADIYLALSQRGPQNISQLSRNAGIERTRIYRLVEQLMASNLIEVETPNKRALIKAAPIANLRILIHQRQEELHSLQDELQLIEQSLARTSLSDPVTRVQLYQGSEGVQRMMSNQLQAKSELLVIAYKSLEPTIGGQYLDSYTQQSEANKLQTRILAGETYIDSQRKRKATNVLVSKEYIYRYLPATHLTITYTTVMYDDIVAQYHWQNDQIYGSEIYNHNAATAQRQMFEMLWQSSSTDARL